MKSKDIKEENTNSNLILKNDNNKGFGDIINVNNKNEEDNETDQGNNYIICIYDIKESNLYQQINILNYKTNVFLNQLENVDKEEIEKNYDIYINNKKIDFTYTYKFYEIGQYTIKFVFNKVLTNISCLFAQCNKLTTIDLSHLNTKYIWNIKGMFCYCISLKDINLSNFNTKTVRDVSYIFYGCRSLTTLDLSNMNTKSVRDMSNMFYEYSSLISLQFINYYNNNTIDMGSMFSDCFVINSPLFVTDNVKDMSWMFYNCSSLSSLNLSNFTVKNDTKLAKIFFGINKSCKIICNDKQIKNQIK